MTTAKIQKYVIHSALVGDQFVWWARVPYGTFQPFSTWSEAADFLKLRHHLRSDEKTWRRR